LIKPPLSQTRLTQRNIAQIEGRPPLIQPLLNQQTIQRPLKHPRHQHMQALITAILETPEPLLHRIRIADCAAIKHEAGIDAPRAIRAERIASAYRTLYIPMRDPWDIHIAASTHRQTPA